MDSTLVVGVAGVVGTLLAGLGAPALSARRSDRAWLRTQRVALYAEALQHAGDLQRRFLEDRWGGMPPGGRSQLPPQDDVTARISLLADDGVRSAWTELVLQERRLDNYTSEVMSGDPMEEIPVEELRPLEAAIESLRTVCRAAATR
jgi:hypothetical protein